MFALLCVLVSNAFAQEPVEAAFVRGHISDGSGVWRANDFGWFYYDLDKDQGGEELRVDLQDRTAEKDHIVYSSKIWAQQFEYEPWGSFRAVAFMGRPYLAGYPKSSITDDISSLNKGDLREVLIDDDSTQTLNNKKAIPLQQGYVLAAAEISEKNGAVNFVLLKNGKPVYASVVSIGENFVYKVNDMPVILVHLLNAMSGEKGEGFAEVDGIFQISDVPYIRLFEGGLLGNMLLTDISEEGIELKNNVSFSLIRDTEIPLTPDLKLIVLDLPDLAYYPVGAFFDYGVHEIRGPVYSDSSSIPVRMGDYNSSVVARWNSLNYSGYYFDQKQSLGAETLAFFDIKGRTIEPARTPIVYQENKTVVQSGLQYTTMLQAKEFEYKPWGHYFIIGFLGAPWFAGYDSSLQGKTPSLSLLENEDLGRVLIDIELQGKILAGNYSLEEGYQMRIMDVGNDSLFLQLLKEGVVVDSSVVKSNTTYIYKKDMDYINDMPIIMMHFGNVFNNGTHSFAILDGIFQISDRYIFPIDPGTGFSELEIVLVQPDKMILINPDGINLNKNSDVNIGPGMDIRVADNDTLRYYLHTSTYVVPPPEPPQVNAQDNVSSLASENFSIIVNAAEIRQVMVSILDSGNRTVFTGDITNLGQGSGDLWGFNWQWNATTMLLSDDNSPVLDASGSGVPAMLYLNETTSPRQVGVKFNPEGRIGAITDGVSIYYVSREEYKQLNTSIDYDAMLANSTISKAYLKIEPGESMLQFIDIINGKLAQSNVNHTLQGNLEALEPHLVKVGASPGRYELRMRVENAVNAIQTFGQFFNVTAAEKRGVSLSDARAIAGGEASITLQTPQSNNEKWVNISYDAARLKPVNISGECKASWQVDAIEGRITAHLPAGCAVANLTFAVSSKAQANETIKLNLTSSRGFRPETVTNGVITIAASDKGAKKSPAMGVLVSLVALAAGAKAGAYLRRRI
ncbi:MAG: S-layer protein domain-containing protein [Methanothrix sp.]|nr:S-layer protein domain-containing protein [Methanothrix sp.]